MTLNDLIAQASRGEPVVVSTLIAAILGTIGAQVTDGQAQNIITGLATLAAGLMARRHTTPQANPAVPTAVVDGAVVPQTKPVLTFSGRRA